MRCRGELEPVRLRGTGRFATGGVEYVGCEGESVTLGIRVRAGKFLDAFGLICGPPPKTLNKRKKQPEGTTLKEGRDKTTVGLPDAGRPKTDH